MAKKAKRREWTKDDLRQLKTLARQKTPVGKIAKSLKRTAGATQQKAFRIGVSLDARIGRCKGGREGTGLSRREDGQSQNATLLA